MRKLRSGVLLATKYQGVIAGAVPSSRGLLLVDCPLRTDDGREWAADLASHGRSRYLALLDHHPDRALGARIFELPIVAHEATLQTMRGWPDAFKGSARPIGAEADRLKRVTGVSKAVPDLSFSTELTLHLGDREVLFWHRPGPTAGSMWVILPEAEIAFIGDTVTVSEPPYVGEADLASWLDSLDELRSKAFSSFLLISGRDGVIQREAVTEMARFLRKVQLRLKRLSGRPESAARVAKGLIRSYRIPSTRREQVLLRLQSGLRGLYARLHASRA